MAKQIERLNAGQTPSLLQAAKGNELIDAINSLRNSKSTNSADVAGITLKTTSEGVLELDVSSDLLEKLKPQTEEEEHQIVPPNRVESNKSCGQGAEDSNLDQRRGSCGRRQ